MPSEKGSMHVYIYKKIKIAKRFYIQKTGHFAKSKTISVKLVYIKSQTLYVTQCFMGFLDLALLYKKHDTLRYVTFLYTKTQTLRKKQDDLRYAILIGFLK